MKICIAQTKSEKANVQRNFENPLEFVERATKLYADLIIFPEWSITNYKPDLAKELATEIKGNFFNPFQDLPDLHQITFGIGMPAKIDIQTLISEIEKIFQKLEQENKEQKEGCTEYGAQHTSRH